MTFTRRKFNRKFRGGKKKTIRKKRKTRRKRRGGMDFEMGKIDMNEKKRTLRRELKAEYNARDKYAADPNLAMTYPYGLLNSAKTIAKLEKDYKEKYGGEEGLKELKENYEKLVCEGVFQNHGDKHGKNKIHNCEKKGGRRKRRKSRKKSKRKKRRKKKTKKRRRRRRQRGGMGQYNCVYPSNVGEIFTGIKLNKNPVLPDPINTNGNTRTVQKLKQKGGGFLDNIGLGDGLLGWYKGTNTVSNIPIRYKGGQPLMKADPMHQPGLYHEEPVHKTANVPKFYSSASDKAVDPKFTIKVPEPTTNQ